MIELSKAHGADVLLAGMQIPPNYGPAYTGALAAVYPELAAQFDVALVEFLLEGVALNPELMQQDSIHPNAAGQEVVFANVWPVLAERLHAR
jgi:acyl-CoA thioesterase-1